MSGNIELNRQSPLGGTFGRSIPAGPAHAGTRSLEHLLRSNAMIDGMILEFLSRVQLHLQPTHIPDGDTDGMLDRGRELGSVVDCGSNLRVPRVETALEWMIWTSNFHP